MLDLDNARGVDATWRAAFDLLRHGDIHSSVIRRCAP